MTEANEYGDAGSLSLPMDYWVEIELLEKPKRVDFLKEMAKIVSVGLNEKRDSMPKHWVNKRSRLSAQIEYMTAIEDALSVLYLKLGGVPH